MKGDSAQGISQTALSEVLSWLSKQICNQWWDPRYWGDAQGAVTLKLHGDVEKREIVLTRRDYRRQLYSGVLILTSVRKEVVGQRRSNPSVSRTIPPPGRPSSSNYSCAHMGAITHTVFESRSGAIPPPTLSYSSTHCFHSNLRCRVPAW